MAEAYLMGILKASNLKWPMPIFVFLVVNFVTCQLISAEWSRMVEVDSNMYQDSLRGGDEVIGSWVEHGDQGRVWLVGLGPCVLTISHTTNHMIDVTTKSCYGISRQDSNSNSSSSNATTDSTTSSSRQVITGNTIVEEGPKTTVGYIAACAVDDNVLVVHIAYKEEYLVKGLTYEYNMATDEWNDHVYKCNATSSRCPGFGRQRPVMHCTNDGNMVVIVDDVQDAWSWHSTLGTWSKLPFLLTAPPPANWTHSPLVRRQPVWSVPTERPNHSAIWLMHDAGFLLHGTMMSCGGVCSEELGWKVVAPGHNYSPRTDEILGRPTVTWIDHDGNLWLYDGLVHGGNFTELWLFDVHLTSWTRITLNKPGPRLCDRCVASVIVHDVPGNVSVLIVDSHTDYMAYWNLIFDASATNGTLRSEISSNSTQLSSVNDADYELGHYRELVEKAAASADELRVPEWHHHTDVFGPLIFFGTSLTIFATFGVLWFAYKCVHCPTGRSTNRLLGTDSTALPHYTVLDANNLMA